MQHIDTQSKIVEKEGVGVLRGREEMQHFTRYCAVVLSKSYTKLAVSKPGIGLFN